MLHVERMVRFTTEAKAMADGSSAATVHPVVQAARDGICAHCGKQLPLHDEGNPAAPYFCGLDCFYGKVEADKLKALRAPATEEADCIVCGEDCEGGPDTLEESRGAR